MLTALEIQKVIEDYAEIAPKDAVSIGYGYKEKNGVRTGELAVVVTLLKKKPIEEVPENELVPKYFEVKNEIIKTDVVEGTEAYFLQCPTSHYTFGTTPPVTRYVSRPIMGGVSVTNLTSMGGSRGTLGLIAVDNDTNSLIGVSNNHVLIDDAFYGNLRPSSNGITNVYLDISTQPHEPELGLAGYQYSIGMIKKYVPLVTVGYNQSDCAAITLNESQIDYATSFLQKGLTYSQPMEFATTQEIDDLLTTNPFLYSAGRTTGPKGELDMKLLVNRNFVVVTPIRYDKQGVEIPISFNRSIEIIASATTVPDGFICTWPSGPGDSGSAISADFNGVRKIIGLIYAGRNDISSGQPLFGLVCRIDDIAQQLNISAWTGQTVNFSNTAATEFHCITTNGGDKNIVLTGNTFWQLGLC